MNASALKGYPPYSLSDLQAIRVEGEMSLVLIKH